jgi:manganese/iron transport system ATP-binding protein
MTKNIDYSEPARLEFENVSIGYNGQPVLENLTFQIPWGAQVALVGPNGAGKSTLFKALVGLIPVRTGKILIHGLPLRAHKECVAYIPQREEVDWRFPLSVMDVVMMGRYGCTGWVKRPDRSDYSIVQRCIEQLGISNIADRSIGELSGGQQQRVFLARALAQEPHILLMDEPFTGVDIQTQEATLDLLTEIRELNVTVIISTHDLTLAAQRFEKVLLINHRLIAFGDADKVFTPEAVSQAFGSQVFFMNGTTVVDQCCAHEEHDSGGKND